MTYHVKWIQSALDDLSTVWMNADSAMRVEINLAVKSLDKHLEQDPFSVSESRDPSEWVCFFDPIGALIEVETTGTVWVLSIWRFR